MSNNDTSNEAIDAKFHEDLAAKNWAKLSDEQFEMFCKEVRPSLLREIRRRCEARLLRLIEIAYRGGRIDGYDFRDEQGGE